MIFLERLFGIGKSVPDDNVEAICQYIRKWRRTESREEYVAQAMRALGNFPSSEEALDYLLSGAGRGLDNSPTTMAAIEGLGRVGNPRAIECLVIVSTCGCLSSSEMACEALRHPSNRKGISILLNIALTHEWPEGVKSALRALRHIGTPEACAAIDEFRRTPSRRLFVQYFDTPETVFSSNLGQPPSDLEWILTRSAMQDDIRWGKREDALDAVKALLQLQKADNIKVLSQVESFLNSDNPEVPYPDISRLTAYPSELTREGIEIIIKSGLADVPARKKEIRDLIASSDVTLLRAFLIKQADATKQYKTMCSLVGIDVPVEDK